MIVTLSICGAVSICALSLWGITVASLRFVGELDEPDRGDALVQLPWTREMGRAAASRFERKTGASLPKYVLSDGTLSDEWRSIE